LLESLSIFTALAPGSARSLLNTRTDLGRLYLASGRYADAARMLGADKDAFAENFDSPAAMRSRRIELANYYLAVDDVPGAQRMLDEAMAATGDATPTAEGMTTEFLIARGRVRLAADQTGAAVLDLQQALALLATRWGEEHWQVAVARAELARALLDNGELNAGLDTLAEAHAGLESSLGPGHPRTLAAGAALQATSAEANK
jgi:hypothetical protein